MHIIGIDIRKGDPKVLKNLRAGWYPFGDYMIPSKDNHFQWRKTGSFLGSLYQRDDEKPYISISCIVGKNGSGKTTLLDILYMILNNFSYSLINTHNSLSDSAYCVYAFGIEATLYFEIDGILSCISVMKDCTIVQYCTYNSEQDSYMEKEMPREQKEIDRFLSEFFYTIGMNYSLYSMQFEEDYTYDYEQEKKITKAWLRRIYKNEEDYYYPITISPIRNGGLIDIEGEKALAKERLAVLFILLCSKRKTLAGYTPTRIEYKRNKNYEKGEGLDFLVIYRRLPDGLSRNLIARFQEEWKESVYKDIIKKPAYLGIKDILLYYLAYHSVKLCLTYKSYGDVFHLAQMQSLEDSGDYKGLNDFIPLGNYQGVISKIQTDIGSITLFYQRYLQYIRNMHIHPDNGSITEQEIVKLLGSGISYFNVYNMLPPSFYKWTLFLKRNDSDHEIELDQLSSGEKQKLYSCSSVLEHIQRIAFAEIDVRVVPYKNINIVIDEVELYAHPEQQRSFISDFVELLNDLQIDRDTIHSINMIIATHSPFLLSDVPDENILRLEKGKAKVRQNMNTFCSNIYELMANSFFMEYPMGEVARKLIGQIVKAYNQQDQDDLQEIRNKKDFYVYLKGIIGDPYLRETVSMMIDSIINEKNNLDVLKSQKEQIEHKLEQLNKQIELLDETNKIQ